MIPERNRKLGTLDIFDLFRQRIRVNGGQRTSLKSLTGR